MSNPAPKARRSTSRGLTTRSLLLGIALIVANAYWLNEAAWGNRILAAYKSLFANAVFCLFVFTLVNLAIKHVSPRYALTEAEMFVVYIMTVMVSTLAGNTNMGYMLYLLAHPYWFATPENDWARLFGGYIPDWFTVRDERVLRQFYEGDSSFFTPENMHAWLVPMIVWSAFIFVLYGVLLCLNAILRRQFTDYERLTYPITQMPLAMGREPGTFLRNRFMWSGFAVAAAVQLWNGMQFYYPVLPKLPLGVMNITHLFSEKPWDAIGVMFFSLGPPAVIGLTFLMPVDMAFSSWFFYVFGKGMTVLAAALGRRRNLYLDEQAMGAWVGLSLLTLWVARRHLRYVWHAIVGKAGGTEDAEEPMSYRVAGYGAAAGVLLLLAFGTKAGATLWAVAVFFVLYFLVAISLTKVRAGLGPPVHEAIYKDPGTMMTAAFGSRLLGVRSMTILSFFYWLNRVNPAHPMPNQMEAYHVGRQSGVPRNRLMAAILVAIGIGVPVTFIIFLALTYERGGAGAIHEVNPMREPFRFLEGRVGLPSDPNGPALVGMGVGAAATLFLTAMKLRFLWWPFHPIGYVIGTGRFGDMFFFWFAVLLSWAIKVLVLKYGGYKAYRRAVPLFVGLILGNYTVACIWSLIAIIGGVPTYQTL